MPEQFKTELKQSIIDAAVKSFPEKGKWEIFECKNLVDVTKSDKQWKRLERLDAETGGNYAFLLPAKYFKSFREIELSGPSSQGESRVIKFKFKPTTRHHFPRCVPREDHTPRRSTPWAVV